MLAYPVLRTGATELNLLAASFGLSCALVVLSWLGHFQVARAKRVFIVRQPALPLGTSPMNGYRSAVKAVLSENLGRSRLKVQCVICGIIKLR